MNIPTVREWRWRSIRQALRSLQSRPWPFIPVSIWSLRRIMSSYVVLAFKCQLCFIKGMMFNKCRWNNRPRSMTTKLSHVHITVCWPNFLVTFSLSQDDAKPRPKESFTIPGVGRRQTLTFRSKCQKFALNTRSVSERRGEIGTWPDH